VQTRRLVRLGARTTPRSTRLLRQMLRALGLTTVVATNTTPGTTRLAAATVRAVAGPV